MISLRQFIRASRKYELPWRYGFNLAPVLSYNFASRSVSPEAARVLDQLNSRGVAITSAASLLGPSSLSCYAELKEAVEKLEDALAHELSTARARAINGEETIGHKTFNRELLGSNPELDPESVYARFALQEQILQIANSYFGMYTRLRYYNVWHTFATQGAARESQLWHYDREDRYILKVFVYFSNVDDGAGPFTYAPGTHQKKRLRREPDFFIEGGVRRSTDRQMGEIVSPQQWVKCTGPKGTIVFADTRGYHKGGMAYESDRVMYTCMFTSKASQSKELFRPVSVSARPSNRQQSFALSSWKWKTR